MEYNFFNRLRKIGVVRPRLQAGSAFSRNMVISVIRLASRLKLQRPVACKLTALTRFNVTYVGDDFLASFSFVNPPSLLPLCRSSAFHAPEWCYTETLMALAITSIPPAVNYIHVQCESKNPPSGFLSIFSKRLGIVSPNFTSILYVPIYARLQIFIQLSATLTKLCHI